MSLLQIALLEDDEFLADGITQAIQGNGLSVDHFTSGDTGFRAIIERDYSLLILDLNLPKMSGLEILEELRRRSLSIPILILTARDTVEDRVHGLNLGADDYLTKPFDLAELEARIKALLRRRDAKFAPEITIGKLRFDIFGRRAQIDGKYLDLTARETDLLEVLLAHRGRPVHKEDLLDRLFGLGREVGANALEVCMHRLRKKCANGGVRFDTLRGIGYLLEEEL